MALKLVYYGNETLKKVADEVADVDGELIDLIDAMYNIMYSAKGVGLAAPQVEISKRLIIYDTNDGPDTSHVIINPVIKEVSDDKVPYDEGCLSVPGISSEIIRPEKILISGVDRDGNEVEFEADGLQARVIQHEIDHLNGILFIDHLEVFLRNELRSDLKKIKKLNKEK